MTTKRSPCMIELHGQTKTAHQWCIERGLSFGTFSSRVKAGWSHERSITTPVDTKRRATVRRAYGEGVLGIQSIHIDPEWASVDCAAMLHEIAYLEGGVSKQALERAVINGLKRSQVAMIAIAINDAMPHSTTDYASDLVAYAIEERLGYALVAGDLSVMELREMFEKKLPFAS